jgi:hypothetical protein
MYCSQTLLLKYLQGVIAHYMYLHIALHKVEMNIELSDARMPEQCAVARMHSLGN